MKLLYFGDRHNRISTPENRIDDFLKTMYLKDQEIIKIGKKYEVKAYLQPGDFWDTPNPPLDYASSVISKWFNIDVFEILNQIVNSGALNKDSLNKLKDFIPMVGVVGNHELFGNNINTLPKTMIGFMEKLGLIRFATKDNPYIIETEDGLTVAITGTHYHLDIDSPSHIDDYVVDKKLGDYHIHIVHGMLSDKSMGKLIRHTTIDQIRHTKADLTISGHDHIGFPLTQIDGKYFVNTGAIPRLSNDVKEIARKPKVLLIDISKDNGLQLKEVYLKTGLDGNIVLDRKKINAKKEKQIKLEEFKKAVRDAGLIKKTDISEIIRDIADNKNLTDSIRDDVVNRVSEKIKAMDGGLEEILPEAYIDRIVIENFMSHQYTEIEPSRGFNIFVGESRQGKSAVLRALDWVYESRPLGKAFIRKGSEYAKVTLYLSNGYIVSRYIEAKRGGKNGYFITNPKTGDTEFHNTKILPEVQKLLGFTLFKVDDKDLQFNINFLKQGAGWFLIGDQFSAPTKAKIIGAIYGTQYADAVIRDLELEERRLNEKMKDTVEEYQKLDNFIKEYEYLPELKKSINSIEKLINETKTLEERRNNIEKILNEREQLKNNIRECEEEIKELNNINKAHELLYVTQKEMERKIRINDVLSKYEEYSTYLKNSTYVANLLGNVSQWQKQFEETSTLFERRNTLEFVIQKRNELLKNIKEEEEIIKLTANTPAVRKLFKETTSLNERYQMLNKLIETRCSIVSNIKEQEEIIKQTCFTEKAESILLQINKDIVKRNELVENVQKVDKLQSEKEKLEKWVKGCEKILKYTQHNEQARITIDNIKSLIEKKSDIAETLESREKLVNEINKLNLEIDKYSKKLEGDVKRYQEVLEKAGKCPVCLGTIDKATINRIVDNYLN